MESTSAPSFIPAAFTSQDMNIGSSLDMSRPLLAQTSHSPSMTWTDLFKVPRLLLHLDYRSLIALSQVNRQLHQAIDPQIASKEDKFGFVMKAERDFPQHFPKDESGWPGNFACYYCFRVRNPKYFDIRSILVRKWKRVCIECFKIASNQHGISLSSYPFDAGNTSQQTCEPIYQSPIVSHPAPLAVTPPDELSQRDQHRGVLPRVQGRLAEQGSLIPNQSVRATVSSHPLLGFSHPLNFTMETQGVQFHTHACVLCSTTSLYGDFPTCTELANTVPLLYPSPNPEAASQAVVPYDTSNTETIIPPDEACSRAFFPVPALWTPATDATAPLVSQEQQQLFRLGAAASEASLANDTIASLAPDSHESSDQLPTFTKDGYEIPIHRSVTMYDSSEQPLHRSHDSINRKWKKEDEEELLRRGQSGDWVNIGKCLKRTPVACYARYMRLRRTDDNHKGRHWMADDNEELLRRGRSRNWVDIGKYFKRTPNACYNQYVNLTGRDNNERRNWTVNDDEGLLHRGQSGDWVNIGKCLKRTPAACRRRYGKLMRGGLVEPGDRGKE